MKFVPVLIPLCVLACGGQAIGQTGAAAVALARAPTSAEARFVAQPHRCRQFLGDDGAEADNVDASYARQLASALRSGPGSLERIRAACEKKFDQARYQLDFARYRLAK